MSLVLLKKKMQRGLVPFLWAFVILFAASAFSMFNGGGGQMSGGRQGGDAGVFAKIGDATISQADFDALIRRNQEFQLQLAQMGQPMTSESLSRVPGQSYQQILNQFAAAAAAEEMGVRATASEAEADVRAQIEEKVKEVGAGSTPAEVAQIRNVLLNSINAQSERRNLLARRLQEKLNADAKPVEVKVAHILIKTDKRSDAEALKLAQDVARQAKAGGDFAKLAARYSEDEGSKKQGGVAGWASAQPSESAAKEAPGSFVQEFTAGSLALAKGQISNPVRSTFGYHVIKALEVRDFQPKTPPAPKPDPKAKPKKPEEIAKEAADRRKQAVDSYKSMVASTIMQGLIADQTKRLEAKVTPESAWLKGYLAEQKGGNAATAEAVKYYTEALKSNDPAAGQGLAYTVVRKRLDLAKDLEGKNQKSQAQEQYREALTVLDRWARSDADLLTLKGDAQTKLGEKTKALASYQDAMDRARRNQSALLLLESKFKELGRKDLSAQAATKVAALLADEEKERKARQQAQMAEAIKKISATAGGRQVPIKLNLGGKKPGGAPKGDLAPKAGSAKAPPATAPPAARQP